MAETAGVAGVAGVLLITQRMKAMHIASWQEGTVQAEQDDGRANYY